MKYPVGIQDFKTVRENDYFYADKSALLYKLVKGGQFYFLSRPRRFGKSLLISMMECYFKGERNLFKGLAIDQLEKDWIAYPVLHLDLNARNYADKDSLLAELNKHLEIWEKEYGDEFKDRAPEERFQHVILNAYKLTGKKVVILVDEYDKPLLQAFGNKELQDDYRSTLKGGLYTDGILYWCDEILESQCV